jgi:hypothetical protein
MIAFVRGRLGAVADAGEVRIHTGRGPIVARTYSSLGALVPGEDVVAASATIAVGLEDHGITALLGRWPPDRADPAGPLGLASAPVIVLPERATAALALAGVARAGRAPAVASLEATTPAVGLALLAAAAEGAEVMVLTEADGRHIDLVRILGGRAVAALPSREGSGIIAWLAGTELGADIPIPTTDPDGAAHIASLGLEVVHQFVQVDPTPAFDEAADEASGDFNILTAAAAGVLAGRIAAGNRRWRADTSA